MLKTFKNMFVRIWKDIIDVLNNLDFEGEQVKTNIQDSVNVRDHHILMHLEHPTS